MTMRDYYSCRGCGIKLCQSSNGACHPKTKRSVPTCFYGGFVCSEQCDWKACLELERTMPGHGWQQKEPGMIAMQHIKANWRERENRREGDQDNDKG